MDLRMALLVKEINMLIFDAFKKSELQTFMALLSQFESSEVTDIRFVREKLQRYLDNAFVVARADRVRYRLNTPKEMRPKLCPSCGKVTLLYKSKSIEGYPVNTCKCGYTQMAVK